jgi:hypothetical protein
LSDLSEAMPWRKTFAALFAVEGGAQQMALQGDHGACERVGCQFPVELIHTVRGAAHVIELNELKKTR